MGYLYISKYAHEAYHAKQKDVPEATYDINSHHDQLYEIGSNAIVKTPLQPC